MESVDTKLERKVLAALLQHEEALQYVERLDSGDFTEKVARQLFRLIEWYSDSYHKLLSGEAFERVIKEELQPPEGTVALRVLHGDLCSLSVDYDDLPFFIDSLQRHTRYRGVVGIVEAAVKKIDSSDVDELSRAMIVALQENLEQTGVSEIERGYTWERARDRWDRYQEREKNGGELDGISSDIPEMDDVIGGLQPSTLILFFGKTGGGKSRLLMNLAYNVAKQGYEAMYISREMSRDHLERCIDSRDALVDFERISKGQLDEQNRDKYKQSLRKQEKRQDRLYVVDISSGGTTGNIISEVERYKALTGNSPAVICVDYLNLLTPTGHWSNTSERLGLIAQEMHDIARQYQTCVITATQENRAASHAKEKGIEHVYGSSYIIPHTEVAIYLEIDEDTDGDCDILWCHPKKNRYGSLTSFPLYADWSRNYVGNWNLRLKLNKDKDPVLTG